MPTVQSREIRAVERTTRFELASCDWRKRMGYQLHYDNIAYEYWFFSKKQNVPGLTVVDIVSV